MATMTEEEWETLRDGLDTSAILESVDAVDRLRQALSGMDEGSPPAIRDDLLKLHQLGLAVQQRGTPELVAEFFDQASDLDFQVSELMDALGEIQSMFSSITDLYPESLSYEGGDDD